MSIGGGSTAATALDEELEDELDELAPPPLAADIGDPATERLPDAIAASIAPFRA